jgi:hypothetical protein
MKQKVLKISQAQPSPESKIFPEKRGLLFVGFVVLSFLINFTLYLMTLAPTVTFEDSGEFICAAYHLGVPHEPGYPLFAMLGKLFTLLPFGTVAFRVNCLSAFFTALAGVFVFFSTVLLVEKTFKTSPIIKKLPSGCCRLLVLCVGLFAALLFGTSLDSWEQAVITEVYGLNSFFTGLFLFLLLLLTRQRDERKKQIVFYSISAVMGLSLTNHTTSAMLIPLFVGYVFLADKKLLLKYTMLLKSSGFFLLGLLPMAYLPWAARRKPIMNWGDPENLTNFIRAITRHQYGQSRWTMEGFLSQFWVFLSELLTKQWFPIVLLFAFTGMVALFKKEKPYFGFALFFLFFSMPVMTFMTNFDVSNPATAFEHKALVSVFYIPAYLFLSILMGTGVSYAISLIPWSPLGLRIAAILLPLVAFGVSGIPNFGRVNMHGYFGAREYANNIFRTLPENSLLFVHWDPFSFPLMYYQFVEHKRPDLLVLDQMLLKRSWYVQWLMIHYPAFARRFDSEINLFLKAVAPFEDNKPYNGDLLQACYIGMINAFVDSMVSDNRGVYCTYTPEPTIVRGYRLESILSAYKFTKGAQLDTTVSETACDISAFTNKASSDDRMIGYMREYYGNTFGMRAMDYELRGNATKARYCYRTAGQLFTDSSQQEIFIQGRLRQLGQ